MMHISNQFFMTIPCNIGLKQPFDLDESHFIENKQEFIPAKWFLNEKGGCDHTLANSILLPDPQALLTIQNLPIKHF